MASKRLDLIFGLDDGDAVKGLKNIAKESKATGQSFDQLESKGKALARELAASGDKIEANLKGTKAAADALGDALGPELAGKLGRAKIEQTVQGFKELGLTFDEVKADAEALAAEIKRLDSIGSTSGLDQVSTSGEKARTSLASVGAEADKTGSVMANTVGNASQSLADSFGIAGVAGGTLGVTIGQLGEYAAEGGISLQNLVKFAGPMVLVTGAVAGLGMAIERHKEEQKEFHDAVDRSREALSKMGAIDPSQLFRLDAYQALIDSASETSAELDELRKQADDTGISSSRLATAVSDGKKALSEFLQEQARAAGVGKAFAASLESGERRFDILGDVTDEQADSFYNLWDVWEQGNDVVRANEKAIAENSAAVKGLLSDTKALDTFLTQSASGATIADRIDPMILADLSEELARGGSGAETMAANSDELLKVLGPLGADALPELIEAAGGTTEELDKTATATDKATGAMERYKTALDEAFGSQVSAAEAQLDYRRTSLSTTAAIDDYIKTGQHLNDTNEDTRTTLEDVVASLNDAEGAVYAQAEAARTAAVAQAEANGITDTAAIGAAAYKWQLEQVAATLAPGDPLRKNLDGLIGELDSLPDNTYTTVNVDTSAAEGKIATLRRQIGDLMVAAGAPRSGYADPAAIARALQGVDLSGLGNVPQGATGGIVTQPTLALIGEAGPEAVVPLSQMPGASALPSGMGGGGQTVNIYANVIEKDTARWIVEQFDQARRTMGAASVQRAVGMTE